MRLVGVWVTYQNLVSKRHSCNQHNCLCTIQTFEEAGEWLGEAGGELERLDMGQRQGGGLMLKCALRKCEN